MWPSSGGNSNSAQGKADAEESVNLDNMWPSQKPKEPSGGGVSWGSKAGGGADVDELEAKLKKAVEEHEKDKVFYEEALETRMNQMEELEEKNEKLEDQVAEMKDEIEKLKNEKGAGGAKANESFVKPAEDLFLKEEFHSVKLELKDANTENRELKKQV